MGRPEARAPERFDVLEFPPGEARLVPHPRTKLAPKSLPCSPRPGSWTDRSDGFGDRIPEVPNCCRVNDKRSTG